RRPAERRRRRDEHGHDHEDRDDDGQRPEIREERGDGRDDRPRDDEEDDREQAAEERPGRPIPFALPPAIAASLLASLPPHLAAIGPPRSEERRVGKEGRSRGSP